MKEDLGSYELALLAKEKGFKDSVSSYYENKKLEYNSIWGIGTSQMQREFDYLDFIDNKENVVLAPTNYQLQKWLREVHNCHIIIEPYFLSDETPDNNSKYSYTLEYYGKDWKDSEDDFIHKLDFKTYEEALTEALFELLKLIK